MSFLKISRLLALSTIALILTLTSTNCPAGTLTTSYTDPAQFTSIPFGSHSHWLQPWRAYLDTVPAAQFLDGIGIQFNLNKSENPELIAEMLAKHGFRRARVEIGWDSIDYDSETQLLPRKADDFRRRLLALQKYGIRPLILLNAHHGAPGPQKSFKRDLAADARAGDTKIQLNDVSGLKVDYSGLSYVEDNKAAGLLITNIAGNTLSLSKPLPKAIKAGTSLTVTTLKYRPFSPPDGNDYRETMAGWQNYVGTVAKFVTGVLGTAQSADKGFDMEIWNELTFGSYFLSINSYYAGEPYKYDERSIWGNLIKETAAYVEKHSQDFQGVSFSDGFANTIPWPASSSNPERMAAISKHPYAGRKNYPKDEAKSTRINALYQPDKSGFVPTYSAYFPEYFATALQTETLVRDMGPITSEIYKIKHGRNARISNGAVVPNPIWITEVNMSPIEDDPNITAERALAVKAKTTARYFCFFLNKGATQVYLYAAVDGDKSLGIVKDSFLEYSKQSNAAYPNDDTAYTSPALATVKRIAAKMSDRLDPNLTSTRPLQVVSISDTHDRYQFAGDGTPERPHLYNRDVFAVLPFQVNARRFVIPYYVMTRDVMKDLPPEEFTVQIQGVKGSGASVTAYDPIGDRDVPVTVNERGSDTLSVKLTAADYPYLLTIQEAE